MTQLDPARILLEHGVPSAPAQEPVLILKPPAARRPPGLRKFRPDIEGLRAVAVLLVVISHTRLGLRGGYVGVDVFFVISGFLITRQLVGELGTRRGVSLAGFYARRARRILPAATVVIVTTLAAASRWSSPLRLHDISRDALLSAISLGNFRFALKGTDYFQSTVPPSPFQHFWSLSVEEQFYALWPSLLVIVASVLGRRWGRTRSLAWAVVPVIAVSLLLSIWVTSRSPSWAYFGSHTRAWELALGALIAVLAPTLAKMPPALASQMSWVGLGLIVAAAWRLTDSTVYPGSAVILPVMGSALGAC